MSHLSSLWSVFFTYSSVVGHLVCFHNLAAVTDAVNEHQCANVSETWNVQSARCIEAATYVLVTWLACTVV